MGLISRIKTWILQEDVASADLNAEFDNVLNNLDAAHIVGDSSSVGQMQVQVSPGAVGSESLAANASGEIERLRYVIQRMLGSSSPYWYSAPVIDMTTVNASLPGLATLQNGVVSGAVDANGQPMFLVPDGTTNKVTLKATTTPLVCYINGTLTTFSSDVSLTGLTAAPAANNTALIDKAPDGTSYVSGAVSKCAGEDDSAVVCFDPLGDSALGVMGNYLLLKTIGSNITAQNEKQIAFKLDSEYGIGVYRNGGLTRLENVVRGCFFDNTNAALPRAGFADGDTVTLEQIAYIFVLSGATLDVTYNQPKLGGQTPASPASGDYWYDTVNKQWKKYNGTAFVSNPACYLGMAVTNTTATVAARSTDFIGAYSDQNGILIRRDATTNSRAVIAQAGLVSVYGQAFGGYGIGEDFSTSRDVDGSIAAGDLLFFYLDKTGKQHISNISPNRRPELAGYYHPSKPWRCIASGFTSDGSKIDYGVKNLPSIYSRTRTLLARTAASGYTSATSSTICTLKVFARGGRLLVRLNGGYVTIANSGTNQSTMEVRATITDEYAGGPSPQSLGEISNVPATATAINYIPGSAFSVEMGNLSGAMTIVIASVITTAAGTTTAGITSCSAEVWELP